MGLIPVPPGEVATVVTSLEMRQRPPLRPIPSSPLRLVRWDRPAPDRYRALFRRIGTPWLWFSRLLLDDAALCRLIHDPFVQVLAVVDAAGVEVGMVELDHRQPPTCALVYFGLIPELAGRGLGRWLMAEAMARAWTRDVDRVTVNTCTLDHPGALGFYRAQGFEPVGRTLESFPDPRATGLLPADAAPQVPYLASLR